MPDLLQIEGGLNSGVSRKVSQQTGVPEAQVYGVGSFFDLLTDTDKKVRVCTGLSCRMAGADQVLQAMVDAGLPAMGCSCLAACDRPPAVLRDRDVFAPLYRSRMWCRQMAIGTRLMPEIVSNGNLGHVGPEVDDPDTMAINLLGQADWSGKAFAKAAKMRPEEIIEEIETSGLQGPRWRGVFSASFKWNAVCSEKRDYALCGFKWRRE